MDLASAPLSSLPVQHVRLGEDTIAVVDAHDFETTIRMRVEASAEKDSFGRAEVVQTPPPPSSRDAKLMLRYALARKHQEHIIGDLEEAYYTEWLPEHGVRQARRLYWWHAIRSIVPMLWTAVKRSGIMTFVVGAADWLRDRFG